VSGNDARLFDIDHTTGNIFTRAAVDYEQCPSHRLVVCITGTETEVLVTKTADSKIEDFVMESPIFAIVIVSVDDVNEYRPMFPVPVYRRTVFGSQAGGSFLTTVRAIDQDAGWFGRPEYRLQTPTSNFVVERNSGHVWLGNPIVVTSHDVVRIETTVVAEDAGGLMDQVRIELTVSPVGSIANIEPRFTRNAFEFEVPGSTPVGHVIGRVSVIGSEAAQFSVSRASPYFTVDRHTGRVFVVQDLRTLSTAQSQVYIYIG